jgi:bifunctional UDP-N-acetylglucosamine pyrophosphorylase/glucosamine-1-phosphate N-acetyltransferase
MQAVILAAGRGTRLYPITETRTKAMCPVAGKPIVERVMDTLVANEISEFILVISPDDSEIVEYFEKKSQIEASVQFVFQNEQLGMGHALLQAAPFVQDDFILSSCDNLVDETNISRMLTMWANVPPPNGILTLLRVGPEELTRMGVVEIDHEHNTILRIVEKPILEEAPSDIGSVPIYVFSYKLIRYLEEIEPSPRGEYELQDAMQELIDKDGHVHGLLLPDRIDLTHPEDLLRLNLHFLSNDHPRNDMDLENIGSGTRFINPVIIDSGVTIGSNCLIGPNVYIETGAIIENDVRLENCVVLREGQISSGTLLSDKVIC